MKISVNKILFHTFTKIPVDFKSKSFQVSLLWNPKWWFTIDFDFVKAFSSVGIIRINLFGLVDIHWYKTIECDHAGTTFNLNLFGLDLEYENRDIRHWDDDNDKFEAWGI